MKQASELEGIPDRCLSREIPFSCARCVGPCSFLRAANSCSKSSYYPDIMLPVQYIFKFCTQSKENITATITDFMLREAATQIFFLAASCSQCPMNTSKYVSPQVIHHRRAEKRDYFFLFYSKSLFSFLEYPVAEEKHVFLQI